MKKTIDRQFFVETGSIGGSAAGAVKRRGSSDYYKKLSAKAAEARAKKRAERKRSHGN
jgi:hypothetical protein